MTRAQAWEEARRMVTADGATYAQAAAAVGIPLATLQKRAATEAWQDQRGSRATYAATIRAVKTALLAKLQEKIDDSTTTGDELVKTMVAWQKAETAFPEHRYAAEGLSAAARRAVGAEVLELVVGHLADHDPATLERFRAHLVPIGQAWEASCG